MAALDQTYRYAGASGLRARETGWTLDLIADTGASAPAEGRFLRARARHPAITARGLRAVSDIVGARFYIPPAMLHRILAEADPVATVSPGAVRFEGFSACCSTFARLDLDDAALDVAERRNGTTNVDFGREMRAALAAVSAETALHVTIGAEAVAIARDGCAVVERKVPLPLRWIKGFGEVQVAMAGMEPAWRVGRVAAQRFLRTLPRGADTAVHWVSAAGGSVRVAARDTAGAVPLRGAQRLRTLDATMAQAEALEVFVNRATGATAWVQQFGALRLTLVLNRDPWQGFSGDGGLLMRMGLPDDAALAATRAQLCWQDRIETGALAEATGLSGEAVSGALARLAAMGLVGFDLHSGGYFHRVLPFDTDRIAALNPRLAAAEALVDAVRPTEEGAEVDSGGVVHRVVRSADGWTCTCPWYAKHKTARGPCKHVLAAEIQRERQR